MKYIDAEKLIITLEWQNVDKKIIEPVIRTIRSLQQEQPKEICHKCIHHGKDDDYCYNPHGGIKSRVDENGVYECTGFCETKQEQPEVDLDKLVNEEFASHSRTTGYGLEATYNRAELYQLIKRMALVFNARKV